MNRKNFFMFWFVLFLMPLAAENKTPWKGSVSGDYVIYRDKTWKDPAWLGFLYYNDNSIGTFLYIPNKNVRAEILFSGEISDGKFVLTGQNIISERNQDAEYILAVNYLMELLPDLYSFKTEPQAKNPLLKRSTKTFSAKQFGGTGEFDFLSYIPLFHLYSVKDSSLSTVFQLEYIGRISGNNDTAFFKFEPAQMQKDNSGFELKKDIKHETKVVDGINLYLDNHWTQIADNAFLMGNNAFLTVNTVPASSFSDIPDDPVSSAVKLFSLSGNKVKIMIEEMVLSGNEKQFKIENMNYDVETKIANKDIKTVIKKGNSYAVVSLTVKAASYRKYKKYFDALFDGAGGN